MKTLKKIENACVPVALQYLAKASVEQTLSACIFAGMDEEDMRHAAKRLGLALKAVDFAPMELRKFTNVYPEGVYLLFTFDHALVLDNSKIVDPQNKKPPGLRRIIKSAWRVG